MMASELIRMLLEQMAQHGDCEVEIDGEVIYPTDNVYFNEEGGSICIQ